MILLIDAFDSFTYNLVQAFSILDQPVRVVRSDRINLAGARRMKPDAVVLSPGPGRPQECGAHMKIAGSTWSVPMLGVCLGHQALIAATGGRITHAQEPRHGEAISCLHDGTGLFADLPAAMPVGRYHSLIAAREGLPFCWRVTATSPGGEVMAVAHRKLPRWGVQFHPESILTPSGPQLLANFLRLAFSP